MSGRSRRWVCCSAALVLVVLGGWWVADISTSAPHPTDPAGAVSDVAGVHNRRVVAEPAAAKRVEIERLVAVMVAAALFVLAALGGGPATGESPVRDLRDRSLLRSRSPPFAFVSRP